MCLAIATSSALSTVRVLQADTLSAVVQRRAVFYIRSTIVRQEQVSRPEPEVDAANLCLRYPEELSRSSNIYVSTALVTLRLIARSLMGIAAMVGGYKRKYMK